MSQAVEPLLVPAESWYERLARGLAERIAAVDLTRLSTDELNRLTFRFDWFRVEPEDGYEAIVITNGLVSRESPDVFAVEGDKELTAALNAAVEQVNAEAVRRIPRELEVAVARAERIRMRRQRLAPLDADVGPVLRVRTRSREQRPQSRARTGCGSRGPPSRSSDDDDPEPARRALARLELVRREAAA